MILGLGTDLVNIERIRNLLKEPAGERFVQRVLTEAEREVYASRHAKHPETGTRYLALRYAAKEAFSKAMGCGVGAEFSFQDLSVLNDDKGAPVLQFSPRLDRWLNERRAQAHVSLSDESDLAMATVIFSLKT